MKQTRGGKVDEKGNDCIRAGSCDAFGCRVCLCTICQSELISEVEQAWILNMKKGFKNIRIFLVIAISLFLLALPAYHRCTNFSKTKFVSFDLSFENPEQENGLPDNENELKVFGPAAFFTIFLLGINLFEEPSRLFSRAISLLQENSVLLC